MSQTKKIVLILLGSLVCDISNSSWKVEHLETLTEAILHVMYNE